MEWSSAGLRQLAAMLHAAPVEYMELSFIPYDFRHVHHLSSLSHLRVLRLSDGDMRTHELDTTFIVPPICMRDTHSVSWSEARREVLCGAARFVDSDITHEQLDVELSNAVRYGLVPAQFAGELFVTEFIFGGANGREAFFDSVRWRSDEQQWSWEEKQHRN